MPHVKAVCTSTVKGQPKTPAEVIAIRAEFGIEGDAHAGPDSHRQVSLLDEESIARMRAKGCEVGYGAFGENVVTDGLAVDELGIGTVLQLGPSARVQVTQIGKACHSPCAIGRQTGECIMPREGIFAEATADGEVRPGDMIEIVDKVDRETFQAVVITASDRCSRGEREDTAGPHLARMLEESLSCNVAAHRLVPDDQEAVAALLREYSEPERYVDCIFTTGGTGFAPRDVTPEATLSVIDRQAPGIAEAIRHASLAITPRAMLSRAVSGIRNRTLIVNLPGSPKAVAESLEVILPVLPHAIELLRGTGTDCGR